MHKVYVTASSPNSMYIIDGRDNTAIKIVRLNNTAGLISFNPKYITYMAMSEYPYEEFETISIRIISKLPENIIVQIASSIWKSGSRDIGDILKSKLINAEDTDEDIKRLISIHQNTMSTTRIRWYGIQGRNIKS